MSAYDAGLAMETTPSQRLDPRWDWVEVTTIGDRAPRYVRGMCKHQETVPVESAVTGETVAILCLTCDSQLEVAGW